ncbi:NAD(P)H:quinone oxidoreductase [Canna indica]|uniref:NAD(P)H-quinone oxidoreductase subunit M, chloroplastic n=1 Tax=Canna indica TaxID=4628 RepID=A0AAQ3KLS8_9LILI|nr:NAD(P)H:quinone oxidoreductase [Canna indica]
MATTATFLAPSGFSIQGWSAKRKLGRGRKPWSIKAQQQQQQLEQEAAQSQGSIPQLQQEQEEPLQERAKVQQQPPQPMAKNKNMSREYGGQWLSCCTRHVRIYAAYIDPVTHAFDQTQMDKLTLILDPTNEFAWTPDTCQKVYACFQELVDHYEGAPLSEYTLRLIGSDIEHYIRKLLYDGEIKYNMNSRVLNFSMGKPRVKFNSSQIQNA